MKLTAYLMLLVVFGGLTTTKVAAQNAERLLKAANTLYENFNYERAIELYKDVLIEDNSEEAKMRLAVCYKILGNYEQAEYWYKLLCTQQSNNYSYKLAYAQVLQTNGKYAEAKKYYLDYAKYDVWGEQLASYCDQIPALRQQVANYELSLPNFNSAAADFSPLAMGNTLVFASNRSKLNAEVSGAVQDNGFLDLYTVDKQPGFVFGTPQRVKSKINSEFNDGPASYCVADSTFYFSRNNGTSNGKKTKSSSSSLKTSLYTARYDALGRFVDISPFPFNNPDYSFSYPAISPDGQTLYFASDMPGGLGGMDLYVCSKIDTFWSQPINLGATVNSAGNEIFPYLATNHQLYFASNGHASIGGYDLFKCQREQGKWVKTTNMGLPFNSAYDDYSFWVNDTQEYGYFASNRPGGAGFDDIYRFQVPGYMESVAIDSTNIAPAIPDHIVQVFTIDQPVVANPILNKSLGMNKINFKSGDWRIDAAGQLELDKVVQFLKDNPEVCVELGAHTDARGDDFVNYEISQKRADAAREYIFLEGVPANQIITKGYGENEILNECFNNVACSEAQHQQNNRLNVKVLTVKGSPVTVTNPPPYESIAENNPPPPTANAPREFPLPDGTNASTVAPNDSLAAANIVLTPADTLPKMNFKVVIGPYATIDNGTYYSFAELTSAISTSQVGDDNFILLGPYPTIAETEAFAQKAKTLGAKTKIVGYTIEGFESLLSIKKLKKMGYR